MPARSTSWRGYYDTNSLDGRHDPSRGALVYAGTGESSQESERGGKSRGGGTRGLVWRKVSRWTSHGSAGVNIGIR